MSVSREDYRKVINKFAQNLMLHIAEEAEAERQATGKDSLVENSVEVAGELVYSGCKAMAVLLMHLEVPQKERDEIRDGLIDVIKLSFKGLDASEGAIRDLFKKMKGAPLN